jgi:hypothetical protein
MVWDKLGSGLFAALVGFGLSACSTGGYMPDLGNHPSGKDGAGLGELVIDSVSPARGPSTGGIKVAVHGRRFESGSAVGFAGIDSAQVSLTGEEELTATLPPSPGKLGLVEVKVRRPDGKEVARSDLFAYYPGQLSFGTARNFTVDSRPSRLVLGDLNGDSKLDLIVASHSSGSLSLLSGKGDGNFDAFRRVGVSGAPAGLLLSEVTSDRALDVMVACDGLGASLWLFAGKGDGTLLPARSIVSASSATLAGGDYNGDGKYDLAVPYFAFAANGIGFLLGKGDGTFTNNGSQGLNSGSFGISSADFNADGKTDLAVTQYDDSTVAVMANQGGKFASPRYVSAGAGPHSVVAADFNGDSKADLVVSDPDGGALRVLLGNGDSTFQPAVLLPTGGMTPQPVIAVDLNLDGTLDLVTVNVGSAGTVTVMLGKGGGQFAPPLQIMAPGTHNDVVAADVNGDRLPDLVVPVSNSAMVSVLLNTSK